MATGSTGSHDVYIIDMGEEVRVRPAVAILKNSLSIRNLTGYDAQVHLPSGMVPSGKSSTVTIPANGRVGPVGVIGDGALTYSVTLSTPQGVRTAVGESGPWFIMDP